MVDAICSMFYDYCCKYSPFVFPLFVGIGVVDEGFKFIADPTNAGFEFIDMDVGADGKADPKIKFEVNGVVGLLVPSLKLCQHFKRLRMACLSIDFNPTNTSSFYKTTMSDPFSFDVLVFNSHNVSHNLLLISSLPTLLHSTKPLCLIPLHLMSLFSTPTMFPITFLSRFPFRNLILGSSISMKHKQPFTLH